MAVIKRCSNKFCYIAFFIFFINTFNSYAAKDIKAKDYLFDLNNEKGVLSLGHNDGALEAVLTWKNKELFRWRRSLASEYFSKFEKVNKGKILYIVFSFGKGIHGEYVEVWRFPAATRAWSFNSTWPITINNTKDDFSVSYTSAADNNNNFKKLIKRF